MAMATHDSLSWVAMAKLQRRAFGNADNIREVPHGRLETYDMGEMRVGRSILEPGWRWSNSIKPISRTEWCEYHHFGLCVSGRGRVTMREGAELLNEALMDAGDDLVLRVQILVPLAFPA